MLYKTVDWESFVTVRCPHMKPRCRQHTMTGSFVLIDHSRYSVATLNQLWYALKMIMVLTFDKMKSTIQSFFSFFTFLFSFLWSHKLAIIWIKWFCLCFTIKSCWYVSREYVVEKKFRNFFKRVSEIYLCFLWTIEEFP